MEAHTENWYCRALLMHEQHGLTLRYTLTNTSDTVQSHIDLAPELPQGYSISWREAHENLQIAPGQTIAIHADITA